MTTTAHSSDLPILITKNTDCWIFFRLSNLIMANKKYTYNEKTLQYEEYKTPIKVKVFRSAGFLSTVLFTGLILFLLSDSFFPSPRQKALEKEVKQMEYHYATIGENVEVLSQDLEKLHNKDSEVHRMIFGIDPLDDAIWNGGVGGAERYVTVNKYAESGDMIVESLSKVDKLKRKMELQEKSLDTLYAMALKKEKRIAAIPSIKPVQEDALKRKMRNLSGYGIRLHPVHKVKKFHKGIDFTAPRGTAIQATGSGVVSRVEKRKTGYGVNVIIDHGFGYTTLYAHMEKVFVKKGQKVSRGHKIGEVGSTGTSTAPHLHYEVRINGKAVNPIDYCLDGLTPEEYKELVEKASVENQSFD